MYKADNNNITNKLSSTLIIFLIMLTIVQQMPVIKDMFYGEIRIILYLLFGTLSVYSLTKVSKIIQYKGIKFFSIVVAYNFVLFFLILFFSLNDIAFSFTELLIPYGILICSLSIFFTDRQIRYLVGGYITLAVVLGISSIFYYGEGFTITQNYFLEFKNQIGPLLGIAAVIVEVLFFNDKKITMIKRLLLFIAFVLLFLSIIVIRNRSSIVGIIIITFFLIINNFKVKKTIRFYIAIVLILMVILTMSYLGIFNGMIEAFVNSFTMNYELTDLDSLSAGRTDVYQEAIAFIGDNPWLGELGGNTFSITSPVHNYVLNKLVELGFLGAGVLLLFYGYLWVVVIRNILKQDDYLQGISMWILLFSLIISLFEYTYPYGPGVSQLMTWFMLGQYLKTTKDRNDLMRKHMEDVK